MVDTSLHHLKFFMLCLLKCVFSKNVCSAKLYILHTIYCLK